MRPFLALLTQDEHAQMLKAGAAAGFARNGVSLERASEVFTKAAGEGSTGLGDALHLAMGTSVALGIPIGAAWHILQRAATSDDKAEQEQRARIKYYRDVGKNLSTGLRPAPVAAV